MRLIERKALAFERRNNVAAYIRRGVCRSDKTRQRRSDISTVPVPDAAWMSYPAYKCINSYNKDGQLSELSVFFYSCKLFNHIYCI